ncbi:hypothetical protein PROH_12100 [Prochlorothrix hollandica PCC 9006 = CALU 1027]|uniref:DUF4276 family protein n=2 Tax=Prochlorothrix hollandica TaxID=1223 RepID=A0A0M2Q184_PROHO|nr:hypothetical protein PROH_12100 [Prochlorothrix hollandica PCC 9006 = CALU 1027]
MIFECGPAGADKKVCEYLARELQPELEIMSVTLDNKPKLISDCGKAAAQLLQNGCDRVLIIWDLYPAWREKKQKPCRRDDRLAIHKSLEHSGVPLAKTHLICITEELEAWLIADGRAISAVLSTSTHPVSIPDKKKTETVKNPKKYLMKLFKEQTGKPYSDLQHAEKIARQMPDLHKINRCPSFARFAAKIHG